MSSRDQKLTFLLQLSLEPEPISLSNLLTKAEFTYTNRTIRRWLTELCKEGLVQKSGKTKDAKYFAVKADSKKITEISSYFGPKSLVTINKIKKPLHEREAVAYNEKWFHSYKPNISFYLSKKIRMQLKKSGQRANEHDPAGTYAHQIFNRLLIDLSYNSSRLEGCTYSLLDTERLLLHNDTPEGKLDEEKIMILNHKEAIRFLVEKASILVVNEETIFTLHYLLADGLVEPQYAGKVRDHGVRVGGSTYMPFEDPRKLTSQIKEISKKAAAIKDPFEQSFFLLVHVSYLQAFADVNKRTARLAASIPLIAQNYVPLSFNDISVSDYMAAILAIYEYQEVYPLIDLYVHSYMKTCTAYDSTIKAMGFDEVRVRYRQQRRNLLREIISEKIIGIGLKKIINKTAQQVIPLESQSNFIEDTYEDLEQIDKSRIVGLGITDDQLQEWLILSKKTNL